MEKCKNLWGKLFSILFFSKTNCILRINKVGINELNLINDNFTITEYTFLCNYSVRFIKSKIRTNEKRCPTLIYSFMEDS